MAAPSNPAERSRSRPHWRRWVVRAFIAAVALVLIALLCFPQRSIAFVSRLFTHPWFPTQSGVVRAELATISITGKLDSGLLAVRVASNPSSGFFIRSINGRDAALVPPRVTTLPDGRQQIPTIAPPFDEASFSADPPPTVVRYAPASPSFVPATLDEWRAQSPPAQHGLSPGFTADQIPVSFAGLSPADLAVIRSWLGSERPRSHLPPPRISEPFQLWHKGVNIGLPEPFVAELRFSPTLRHVAVFMVDGGEGRTINLIGSGASTWHGSVFVAIYDSLTGQPVTDVYKIPGVFANTGWTHDGTYLMSMSESADRMWILPNRAIVDTPPVVVPR